jgi:hypothetical protein
MSLSTLAIAVLLALIGIVVIWGSFEHSTVMIGVTALVACVLLIARK